MYYLSLVTLHDTDPATIKSSLVATRLRIPFSLFLNSAIHLNQLEPTWSSLAAWICEYSQSSSQGCHPGAWGWAWVWCRLSGVSSPAEYSPLVVYLGRLDANSYYYILTFPSESLSISSHSAAPLSFLASEYEKFESFIYAYLTQIEHMPESCHRGHFFLGDLWIMKKSCRSTLNRVATAKHRISWTGSFEPEFNVFRS